MTIDHAFEPLAPVWFLSGLNRWHFQHGRAKKNCVELCGVFEHHARFSTFIHDYSEPEFQYCSISSSSGYTNFSCILSSKLSESLMSGKRINAAGMHSSGMAMLHTAIAVGRLLKSQLPMLAA